MPAGRPKGYAKTGGRRKGSVNKLTADVKALADVYTAEAVKTLAAIMRNTDMAPQARVIACRELLDRGHGKPAQAITGPAGGPLVVRWEA